MTKLGLLFVYDLETATAIYRSRISPEPVFIASASETTGGFYAINRKGQVRERACLLLLLLWVLLRCAIIAAPIWPRLPVWSQPLHEHHSGTSALPPANRFPPHPPIPSSQVLLGTVNEAALVPFVSGQLNNIDLALSMARRAGLPGAEALIGQQFERMWAAGQYKEAAEAAAESPQVQGQYSGGEPEGGGSTRRQRRR